MKVTLKHVGNSGAYESDVYERIVSVRPMNDVDASQTALPNEDGTLDDIKSRGLFYNPGMIRVILIEPDDVKEPV